MKDKTLTKGDLKFILKFRETWALAAIAALLGFGVGVIL